MKLDKERKEYLHTELINKEENDGTLNDEGFDCDSHDDEDLTEIYNTKWFDGCHYEHRLHINISEIPTYMVCEITWNRNSKPTLKWVLQHYGIALADANYIS